MASKRVPEGHDMFFCGGFTVPTPAPGGWGGSGTESTLGCDPLPGLFTTSPADAAQACAIAWMTGTIDVQIEFTTRTNNPGTVDLRVYRAAPEVAPTSATLIDTDSIAYSGGGVANSETFNLTVAVTIRDRLIFTLEHSSSGPGVAWGNINLKYQ